MFERAFVATTVALGGTVDDALEALAGYEVAPATQRMPEAPAVPRGPGLAELVAGLRAPTRAQRAGTLAVAITEILQSLDEGRLR